MQTAAKSGQVDSASEAAASLVGSVSDLGDLIAKHSSTAGNWAQLVDEEEPADRAAQTSVESWAKETARHAESSRVVAGNSKETDYEPPFRCFVSGISFKATDKEIFYFFGGQAKISNIKVQRGPGYIVECVLQLKTKEALNDCLRKSGQLLRGRNFQVRYINPQSLQCEFVRGETNFRQLRHPGNAARKSFDQVDHHQGNRQNSTLPKLRREPSHGSKKYLPGATGSNDVRSYQREGTVPINHPRLSPQISRTENERSAAPVPAPEIKPTVAKKDIFGEAKPVDTSDKFREFEERERRREEERRQRQKEEQERLTAQLSAQAAAAASTPVPQPSHPSGAAERMSPGDIRIAKRGEANLYGLPPGPVPLSQCRPNATASERESTNPSPISATGSQTTDKRSEEANRPASAVGYGQFTGNSNTTVSSTAPLPALDKRESPADANPRVTPPLNEFNGKKPGHERERLPPKNHFSNDRKNVGKTFSNTDSRKSSTENEGKPFKNKQQQRSGQNYGYNRKVERLPSHEQQSQPQKDGQARGNPQQVSFRRDSNKKHNGQRRSAADNTNAGQPKEAKQVEEAAGGKPVDSVNPTPSPSSADSANAIPREPSATPAAEDPVRKSSVNGPAGEYSTRRERVTSHSQPSLKQAIGQHLQQTSQDAKPSDSTAQPKKSSTRTFSARKTHGTGAGSTPPSALPTPTVEIAKPQLIAKAEQTSAPTTPAVDQNKQSPAKSTPSSEKTKKSKSAKKAKQATSAVYSKNKFGALADFSPE